MKALTLWQPWASLVEVGAKTIETRAWSTRYRGPLAIHAAATWLGMAGAQGNTSEIREALAGRYPIDEESWTTTLPFGAVVATAELVDVVPMVADTDPIREIIVPPQLRIVRHVPHDRLWLHRDGDAGLSLNVDEQLPYGDFRPGRYAWLLDAVRALVEPVPASGRQQLWEWVA